METKRKNIPTADEVLMKEIEYVLRRNPHTYFLRQVLAYALSLEKSRKK